MTSLAGRSPSTSAIAMQRPEDHGQRLVPAVALRVRTQRRNRPAQAVMLEDELEPSARMDPFLVGNLNRRGKRLLRLGAVLRGRLECIQRLSDRLCFTDGAQIRPRTRDVAVGQKEPAHFARGFDVALLVALLQLRGDVANRLL